MPIDGIKQELKSPIGGVTVEGNLFLPQDVESVVVFALPAVENIRVSLVRVRVPTAE